MALSESQTTCIIVLLTEQFETTHAAVDAASTLPRCDKAARWFKHLCGALAHAADLLLCFNSLKTSTGIMFFMLLWVL